MNYSHLLFDVADGLARVTVNRPDKLNALNDAVIAELGDAIGRIESDKSIRAGLASSAPQPPSS